jgi:hypothetical protein
LDSLTEASGSPTISNAGSPLEISASAVTKNASTPFNPILNIDDTIFFTPPFQTADKNTLIVIPYNIFEEFNTVQKTN